MGISDVASLIETYTPLLVLYPEIPPGNVRRLDRNPTFPDVTPVNHDYHPRDVRLVLNQACLRGRSLRHPMGWPKPKDWRDLLDQMESIGYENDLDLLRGVDRTDRDRFWEHYGSIDKTKREHQRRCYARVVEGQGVNRDRILVQYWYASFYNEFLNTHEMDWEAVMVVCTNEARPRPVLCAATAHHGGLWLPWDEVQRADAQGEGDPGGTHPVVYVAQGSHANYFFGDAVYEIKTPVSQLMVGLMTPPIPLDFVMSFRAGDKQLVLPAMIPEPRDGTWGTGPTEDDDWRWLNQRGRWGSPGRRWDFKFGDYAPFGPPLQKEKWKSPFKWINTRCVRAENPRPPTRRSPSSSGG